MVDGPHTQSTACTLQQCMQAGLTTSDMPLSSPSSSLSPSSATARAARSLPGLMSPRMPAGVVAGVALIPSICPHHHRKHPPTPTPVIHLRYTPLVHHWQGTRTRTAAANASSSACRVASAVAKSLGGKQSGAGYNTTPIHPCTNAHLCTWVVTPTTQPRFAPHTGHGPP